MRHTPSFIGKISISRDDANRLDASNVSPTINMMMALNSALAANDLNAVLDMLSNMSAPEIHALASMSSSMHGNNILEDIALAFVHAAPGDFSEGHVNRITDMMGLIGDHLSQDFIESVLVDLAAAQNALSLVAMFRSLSQDQIDALSDQTVADMLGHGVAVATDTTTWHQDSTEDLIVIGLNDIFGGIQTGSGNDVIYSHAGAVVSSGAGDDIVYGSDHVDVVFGGDGADRLYGGGGNDRLEGGAGDDYIRGGNGDDIVRGNKGNDIVFGDAGNDTVAGYDGDDVLYGGNGDDWLIGHDGNDVLHGGAGDDLLLGLAGADVFVFKGNNDINGGHDTIQDFNAAEGDQIDLSDVLDDMGFDLQDDINDFLNVSQDGNDVVVSFTGDDSRSITISGVSMEDFDLQAMIDSGAVVV